MEQLLNVVRAHAAIPVAGGAVATSVATWDGSLAGIGLCQSRRLQGRREEWRPKLALAWRHQPLSLLEGL